MEIKKTCAPTAFQSNCERILKIGALIVALNTLLLSFYRFYDLNHCITLRDLNYGLFSLLALASAGYTFLCKFRYPAAYCRIKAGLRRLFCPEFLLLLLLLIWALISCSALDWQYDGNLFSKNRQELFDTAISILIFFPLPFFFSRQRLVTAIHTIIHLFTGAATLFMLVVLRAIFQNRWILFAGGGIGMSEEIRLVLNCHPNTTGAYASIFIMFCIYMMITQRPLLKCLYAFAFFIHSLILFYSNSRTCFIAVAICATLSVFFFLWHSMRKSANAKRICICLLVSLLFYWAYGLSKTVAFNVFESVTHLSEILAQQQKTPASTSSPAQNSEIPASTPSPVQNSEIPASTPAPVQNSETPDAQSETNLFDATNNSERAFDINGNEMHGRYQLWAYALESMTYDAPHAIFGVSPSSVFNAIKEMSDGKYTKFYTHNQFLEVGVALGWPGFFLFFFFMVLVARNCLKIGLSREQYPFKGFYVIPITILMLVISNLTEAILLFYHFLSGSLFFLLCGWVTLESRYLPDLPFLKLKTAKASLSKKRNK